MSKVKSFEEYQSSKSEELVHGTPGEDTNKWKGDESGKTLFEINDDSCCSKDCQQMLNDMYETMKGEMKQHHGSETSGTAEEYHKECSEMLNACETALKNECDTYMNRKKDKE